MDPASGKSAEEKSATHSGAGPDGPQRTTLRQAIIVAALTAVGVIGAAVITATATVKSSDKSRHTAGPTYSFLFPYPYPDASPPLTTPTSSGVSRGAVPANATTGSNAPEGARTTRSSSNAAPHSLPPVAHHVLAITQPNFNRSVGVHIRTAGTWEPRSGVAVWTSVTDHKGKHYFGAKCQPAALKMDGTWSGPELTVGEERDAGSGKKFLITALLLNNSDSAKLRAACLASHGSGVGVADLPDRPMDSFAVEAIR
ncbi:hypothetical protein L083_5485 [Actinoplanes sp. N902-109]|nr:hypothetical protein L083_5485 [Actinoplanes sp. N902-109]